MPRIIQIHETKPNNGSDKGSIIYSRMKKTFKKNETQDDTKKLTLSVTHYIYIDLMHKAIHNMGNTMVK